MEMQRVYGGAAYGQVAGVGQVAADVTLPDAS
jgi:hypothetical protein